MSEFLTIEEHREFSKRMDEENARQNKRLGELEENVRDITKLAVSVERLATNMETMNKELAKQGERLEKIESEPADRWKSFLWECFKYVLVAGLAIVAAKIGGM